MLLLIGRTDGDVTCTAMLGALVKSLTNNMQ